jgi:rhodanese-related sulfurtransferase
MEKSKLSQRRDAMAWGIIDVKSLEMMCAKGNVVVVDCRTYDEYVEGHYKNAIHAEGGMLSDRLLEIPRDRRLVFYCDRGAASMLAARRADAMGYEAYSVAGG